MPSVKISTSLLHRLDACIPERKRWRELFGDGLVEVNETVAAVVIREGLGLAWFLQMTCGEKSFRGICQDYYRGVRDEWSTLGPPHNWVTAVDLGHWTAVERERFKIGETADDYAIYCALLSAGKYLANANRSMQGWYASPVAISAGIHHAAHVLTIKRTREVPHAAAALADTINAHCRVINRSIALAGIK